MTQTTTIKIDLSRPNIPAVVYAKQHDADTRKIQASLYSNGAAYIVPGDVNGIVNIAKPDGTGCYYDVDDVTGNVVTFTLVEQALTAFGTAEVEISFVGANDIRLTSFAFNLIIEKRALEDSTIVSSSYYNALLNASSGYIGHSTLLKVKAYYDSLEELEAAITNPEGGDMYGIGTTPPFHIYVYDPNSENWIDNGTLGQSGTIYLGVTSGTADALIISGYPNQIADGYTFTIMPHVDVNSGATLKIGSNGALPILSHEGTPIPNSMMYANVPITLIYRQLPTPAYITTFDTGTITLYGKPYVDGTTLKWESGEDIRGYYVDDVSLKSGGTAAGQTAVYSMKLNDDNETEIGTFSVHNGIDSLITESATADETISKYDIVDVKDGHAVVAGAGKIIQVGDLITNLSDPDSTNCLVKMSDTRFARITPNNIQIFSINGTTVSAVGTPYTTSSYEQIICADANENLIVAQYKSSTSLSVVAYAVYSDSITIITTENYNVPSGSLDDAKKMCACFVHECAPYEDVYDYIYSYSYPYGTTSSISSTKYKVCYYKSGGTWYYTTETLSSKYATGFSKVVRYVLNDNLYDQVFYLRNKKVGAIQLSIGSGGSISCYNENEYSIPVVESGKDESAWSDMYNNIEVVEHNNNKCKLLVSNIYSFTLCHEYKGNDNHYSNYSVVPSVRTYYYSIRNNAAQDKFLDVGYRYLTARFTFSSSKFKIYIDAVNALSKNRTTKTTLYGSDYIDYTSAPIETKTSLLIIGDLVLVSFLGNLFVGVYRRGTGIALNSAAANETVTVCYDGAVYDSSVSKNDSIEGMYIDAKSYVDNWININGYWRDNNAYC